MGCGGGADGARMGYGWGADGVWIWWQGDAWRNGWGYIEVLWAWVVRHRREGRGGGGVGVWDGEDGVVTMDGGGMGRAQGIANGPSRNSAM